MPSDVFDAPCTSKFGNSDVKTFRVFGLGSSMPQGGEAARR
jgi:hypothetical protein